ncbi:MAG: orotidine-5'-phosphate decarboxylase [Cytophagales bacterium]
MNRKELVAEIYSKKSFLCVGLDTDLTKIPMFLLKEKDPIFEFNKRIIDATEKFAVAYKPNIAFYEAEGTKGWESLQKTVEYLPKNCFSIADAKRGDIGNTADMYAKAFFKSLSFDSITIAPYMGKDSVEPFLKYENKWGIVLALTSNPGSVDFELQKLTKGDFLFEEVLKTVSTWGTPENLMYVVGATQADKLAEIRKICPDHFFLVPGVGAQGGSLADVAKYGMNKDCGLLVNSSRGIIYADNTENFALVAAKEAQKIQAEMASFL